jgi:hypothetical protein
MKPGNLVIIMSDEHNPKVMGCNGHPVVKTPNLDTLAALKHAKSPVRYGIWISFGTAAQIRSRADSRRELQTERIFPVIFLRELCVLCGQNIC